MFVASYSLLSSAFFIALLLIRNIGYRIVEGSTIHKVVTYGSFCFFGLVMVMAITLIIGVHQNKRWFFVPWICTTIICHIFATITVVWLVTLTIRDENTEIEGWEIGLLCYHALNLIISTYCVICVFSHFQDLAEGTRPSPLVPGETRRDLTLIFRERSRSGLTNAAFNSDTPRPPPVSMVTPPPYSDTPAPPPYSTFPRGVLSRLGPARPESARSRGVRNSINSAAGPRVVAVVEGDEDEIDDNIVGDIPEENEVSPEIPAPPEESGECEGRDNSPPPSPPPDPRLFRNPPTYRRILPETQLGRQLAEQQRQMEEEQEASQEGTLPQEERDEEEQQFQRQKSLSDEDNADSELSTGSEGLQSSLNPGSDVGDSERTDPSLKEADAPSNRTSSGADMEFHDDLGSYGSGTDRGSSVHSESGLPEADQDKDIEDTVPLEQPLSSPAVESGDSEEVNNEIITTDEEEPQSSFQRELSMALQRLKPPSNEHSYLSKDADTSLKPLEQNQISKPAEKERTLPVEKDRKKVSSPRQMRKEIPSAKKFATVSSSSHMIMDTTLQRSQHDSFLKPDRRKDLYQERARKTPKARGRYNREKRYHVDQDMKAFDKYERPEEDERLARYYEKEERELRAMRAYERGRRGNRREYEREDGERRVHQYYDRSSSLHTSTDQSSGDTSSRERTRSPGDREDRYRANSPSRNREKENRHRDISPFRKRYDYRNSRESERERRPGPSGSPEHRPTPSRDRYRESSPPHFDRHARHSQNERYYEESPRRERKAREYRPEKERSPPRERYKKRSSGRDAQRNTTPPRRGSSPPRETRSTHSPGRARSRKGSPQEEEEEERWPKVNPYTKPAPSTSYDRHHGQDQPYTVLPRKKRHKNQQPYEARSDVKIMEGVYDVLPNNKRRVRDEDHFHKESSDYKYPRDKHREEERREVRRADGRGSEQDNMEPPHNDRRKKGEPKRKSGEIRKEHYP